MPIQGHSCGTDPEFSGQAEIRTPDCSRQARPPPSTLDQEFLKLLFILL
jgi:hypothetical protein